MKRIIGTGLLALSTVLAQAQGLTQSAGGTGSVLFRGSYFSLDAVRAEISAGYNSVDKTVGKNHTSFFGAALKGRNEEGLSGLFSKDGLVPSAAFNAYGGYSVSNGTVFHLNLRQAEILERRGLLQQEIDNMFTDGMLQELEKQRGNLHSEQEYADAVERQIRKREGSRKLLKMLADAVDDSPALKQSKQALRDKAMVLEAEGLSRLQVIDAETGAISEAYKKIPYVQFMIFGYGGIDIMEFKRFNGADTSNLENSFENQSYRGGNFGLGINLQYANWMLGATYDYSYTNNFDLLTVKEYSLSQVTAGAGGNQQLMEEKKITAYTGNYTAATVNRIKVDLIGNFKLDKEAKHHLLVNPYLKANIASREALVLPNSMNVGIGLYFFQQTGKLLGGFYLELPDVQNNYEKAKPLADQNLSSPVKRLTFGLVGKFSFSTILKVLAGPAAD